MEKVKVFAPATIGNIGPGFDVLGLAIANSLGDYVEVKRAEKGVKITEITGISNGLPIDADKNTAGIAAKETLKLLSVNEGVEIKLHKQMPAGSGLGSSAASAAAAAFAVNTLFDGNLTKNDLILPATIAEEFVSGGFFADNTAPALLGGATLTRSCEPLDVTRLGTIHELVIAIVVPEHKILTKEAREILPKSVPMKDFVSNMANACLMVAAFTNDDVHLLGRCVDDRIIEPARAKLIPGFYDVKKAALDAGAYGCSISGAGPAVFTFTNNIQKGKEIGKAMQEAFEKNNLKSEPHVSKVDAHGARVVE